MQYTTEVLKVGETHSEERVNRARKNLKMEDQDIICVADYGFINRFDTMQSACSVLGRACATIEEAAEGLADYLNNPPAAPEPTPTQEDYEAYYNAMNAEIGG